MMDVRPFDLTATVVASIMGGRGLPAHATTLDMYAPLAPIHESDSHGPSCRIYNADKNKNIIIGSTKLKDVNEFLAENAKAPAGQRQPKPSGLSDRGIALGATIYMRKGSRPVTIAVGDATEFTLARAVAKRL